MEYEYQDPIITQRRKGDKSDPYVDKNEEHKIDVNSKVILTEIPSYFHKVQVSGANTQWIEVAKKEIQKNEFKVDYYNKIVTFHSDHIGKQLNFKYQGSGLTYVPPSMIYTERSGFTIKETLDELIERMEESREDIIETENEIKANEKERLESELERKANENTRQKNESSREKSEAARDSSEIVRENQESLRQEEEDARVDRENEREDNEGIRESNEEERQSNEEERKDNEKTRQENEEERVKKENIRSQDEVVRQLNEEIRQNQESDRQKNTSNALDKMDKAYNTTNLIFQDYVETYDDIDPTYPKPTVGWTVQVYDTGIRYRWSGTRWVSIDLLGGSVPLAHENLDGLMSKEDFTKLKTITPHVDTRVIVFVIPNDILVGIQPPHITIPFDGEIQEITSSVSKKGENSVFISIEKSRDYQSWSEVLSESIKIPTDKNFDDNTHVISDQSVREGDIFRLNALQPTTAKNLTLNIKISL